MNRSYIHDEFLTTYTWLPDSIRIFRKALDKQLEALRRETHNEAILINDEIEKVKDIIKKVAEAQKKAADNGDLVEVGLLGKDWAYIHQLLPMYASWRKQWLEESNYIVEAKEPYEEELKSINLLQQQFEKMNVPRGKVIRVTYYTESPKKGGSSSPIAMQITIENQYGQFAVNNYGNMTQKNNPEMKDVVEALNSLTKEFDKSDLSQEDKNLAVANINTIHAQISGGQPKQSIIKEALGTITEIAKFSTIAATITQNLDKIHNALNSIFK